MSQAPEARKVRDYFEAQARVYAGRSERGLWRMIRQREMQAVLELLQPKAGEAILDAGCGAGHYTAALAAAGARLTALDISSAMLETVRARLGVETIQGDLAAAPLAPRFDKILCAGALEFVPDPPAALANLAKALRPDGPRVLVVLLPAASLAARLYRLYHCSHGFRVHLFGAREVSALDAAAAQAGLRPAASRSVAFCRVIRWNPVRE